MGGGGKHYSPSPQIVQAAPVEIPAPAPVEADQAVKKAGEEERRRRAGAIGTNATLLMSKDGPGLMRPADSQRKTLLGG